MKNHNNIANFNFTSEASVINEMTTSFDFLSCDDDSITGSTQIMIDYEDGRLLGVVIQDGQRFGHVFDPIDFDEKSNEVDVLFLNELYYSTLTLDKLANELNKYHSNTDDLGVYWNPSDDYFTGEGAWMQGNGARRDKIYFQLSHDEGGYSDNEGLSQFEASRWLAKVAQ